MVTVTQVAEMSSLAGWYRSRGKKISFVPTMGSLHKGHLMLISKARACGDISIVSIFVNPAQFGPGEDYASYPRNLSDDLGKLETLGVDVVFVPTVEEIYPEGFETYVEVTELERPLCGEFRKGHFRGVATVVLKLFNIVKPHFALFGEKDYQQLKIIQKMVRDLCLDVEVIPFPTVRDSDGLAFSSRNSYLSQDEREKAGAIFSTLKSIKAMFESGVTDSHELVSSGIETLKAHGLSNIDYLRICDPETLKPKRLAERGDLVAVALRLGTARLIDNIRL